MANINQDSNLKDNVLVIFVDENRLITISWISKEGLWNKMDTTKFHESQF